MKNCPRSQKIRRILAKRTDEVKNTPLPNQPEAKKALDDAAKVADKAAKALDTKKGLEAVKNQEQAIKDLQAAKKALDRSGGEPLKNARKLRSGVGRVWKRNSANSPNSKAKLPKTP